MRVAKPGAMLASNTSTLDIDALAAVTGRPQDVVGLHFFSPAHIMRLLEVVRGAQTAPDVLATALAFGKRLGKVAGRRRQLPRLRRQPDDVPLHVRSAVPGRGRRDARAGRSRADRLRDGDGHLRRRRHGRASTSPGASGRSSGTSATPGGRRPLVADKLYDLGRYGQKRGQGLVPLRREPQGRRRIPR